MPSARIRVLFLAVLRCACVAALALPLATPSAEAAVKQRKKAPAKSLHAAKKAKPSVVRHGGARKAKGKAPARKSAAQAAPHRQAAAPGRWTAEKVRLASLAAPAPRPQPLLLAEAPTRTARAACVRGGRIYLLADCSAPLPPALLASNAD